MQLLCGCVCWMHGMPSVLQTFCTWILVLVNISLFSKAIIQLCIASFGGVIVFLLLFRLFVYAPLYYFETKKKSAFWCVIFFFFISHFFMFIFNYYVWFIANRKRKKNWYIFHAENWKIAVLHGIGYEMSFVKCRHM